MGVTCKPIGKMRGIMQKLENKHLKEMQMEKRSKKGKKPDKNEE